MFYTLSGVVKIKRENFFVMNVGGFGMKVFAPRAVLQGLPAIGSEAEIFTSFKVKEDAFEIYGFLSEEELNFFEALIGVNGVGPKSALNIMNVDDIDKVIAAICEGKPELLTKASGVGKKTAERVVLELRGKLSHGSSKEVVGIMESDGDIVDALEGLGYTKFQAKSAIAKLDKSIKTIEDRIKAALKILKNV